MGLARPRRTSRTLLTSSAYVEKSRIARACSSDEGTVCWTSRSKRLTDIVDHCEILSTNAYALSIILRICRTIWSLDAWVIHLQKTLAADTGDAVGSAIIWAGETVTIGKIEVRVADAWNSIEVSIRRTRLRWIGSTGRFVGDDVCYRYLRQYALPIWEDKSNITHAFVSVEKTVGKRTRNWCDLERSCRRNWWSRNPLHYTGNDIVCSRINWTKVYILIGTWTGHNINSSSCIGWLMMTLLITRKLHFHLLDCLCNHHALICLKHMIFRTNTISSYSNETTARWARPTHKAAISQSNWNSISSAWTYAIIVKEVILPKCSAWMTGKIARIPNEDVSRDKRTHCWSIAE